MLFPFALWFGGCVIGRVPLQDSMSEYYGTRMHDVFVAFLCAIGFGLFAYRGYVRDGAWWEPWLSRVATFSAVGIGIFPPKDVKCSGDCDGYLPLFAQIEPILIRQPMNLGNLLHLISTVVFLGILIAFAFFFRNGESTEEKRKRNRLYLGCGITMCVAGVYALFDTFAEIPGPGTFFGEATVIWAFGIAWYVKGGGISWWQDNKQKKPNTQPGAQ